MPCEVITKNTFFIKNIGNTIGFYKRPLLTLKRLKILRYIKTGIGHLRELTLLSIHWKMESPISTDEVLCISA